MFIGFLVGHFLFPPDIFIRRDRYRAGCVLLATRLCLSPA
ncbi:hypothetical protein E1H18_1943 [Caulobacter sp. RHG1]|nr:hypothetical protein [Caulobacter sp. RHG1]